MRGDRECYQISADTLKAIRQNEVPQPLDLKVADTLELFDQLNKLIHQRKSENVDYQEFVDMVHGLLSTNASLPFASEAKSLGLNDADLMLLLWGCNMLVSNDDRVIIPSDYEDLYEGEGPLFRRQVRTLKNGSSPLIEKGLFQLMDNDGRTHSDAHTLTSHVCEELLKGMGIESPTEQDNRLTSHSTIVAKELFYNPKRRVRSRSCARCLHPSSSTIYVIDWSKMVCERALPAYSMAHPERESPRLFCSWHAKRGVILCRSISQR